MAEVATADRFVCNFTTDHSALPYTVTRQAYAKNYPLYGLIATGALVFDKSDRDTPRILLVQRSANDTMPGKWEVPGGACDDEDESILHAVTRELWEEAGLKATHIREAVGNPHLFVTRSEKCICKLNFVVEVEKDDEGRLQPKLDPEEHQQFVWASEAEVRSRKVGDIELDFTSARLEDAMLRTFEELNGGQISGD